MINNTKTTDAFTTETQNNIWIRGCEWVFDHYENNNVHVTRFNSKDKITLDISLQWTEGDRIIDVVKFALQLSREF
jgi:hypothetical protein